MDRQLPSPMGDQIAGNQRTILYIFNLLQHHEFRLSATQLRAALFQSESNLHCHPKLFAHVPKFLATNCWSARQHVSIRPKICILFSVISLRFEHKMLASRLKAKPKLCQTFEGGCNMNSCVIALIS